MANTKGPIYDIYKEFDEQLPDEANTSSAVVLAVYRLKNPVSFDRSKMASINKMVTEGAELRGDNPLLIVSDCTALTIVSSKNSPTHNLSANIKQSARNYAVEILPGDWIMAWMVNDLDKAKDIVNKIKNNVSTNDFKSGLKFLGRVNSLNKDFQVQPDTGKKFVSYELNAVGFKELETSIVYLADLAEEAYQNVTAWMVKMGLDVRDLFKKNSRGAIENNGEKLILSLFDIFLGKGAKRDNQGEAAVNPGAAKGLSASFGGATSSPQIDGANNRTPAPYAFLVPSAISNALGYLTNEDVVSYASIIQILTGRQTYINSKDDADYQRFQPDIRIVEGNRRSTDKALLGSYWPFPLSLMNVPLWQIIIQFINPAVNEIYTAMRVDNNGLIVPTLVMRQIPFTSEAFKDTKKDENGSERVTRFMNLPRWKIDPRLVQSGRLGRSDATRTNFIHIGLMEDTQRGVTITRQLATNKPIFDSLDIQRSGIYPYITTVCAAPRDQAGEAPRYWGELVADRMMGSQLTINGTLNLKGIQAPICIGDNVEFDNLVMHIESVTHTFRQSPNGIKTFTTSLTLTNGIQYDDKNQGRGTLIPDAGADGEGGAPMYAGLFSEDGTQYDPGITTISLEEEPEEEDPDKGVRFDDEEDL